MSTHHHHHHGDHGHDQAHGNASRFRFTPRLAVAAVVVVAVLLSACLVLVSPGQALVVTRFGNPVRVITTPGLAGADQDQAGR